MYGVSFAAGAAKAIRRLPKGTRTRLLTAIEALASEPRPRGSTKLLGRPTAWRIRVGDYRVVDDILDEELLVSVIRVGHRREVYKR